MSFTPSCKSSLASYLYEPQPVARPTCGMLDETAVYELQQLCTGGGLTQDSLSRLIDAGLSVQSLLRSDAAAMAQAKKAGLGMAERQALKEALRQHRDEVCSLSTTWNAPAGCNASQHASALCTRTRTLAVFLPTLGRRLLARCSPPSSRGSSRWATTQRCARALVSWRLPT